MNRICLQPTATLLGLLFATVAYAQQLQPAAAVPKLVRFTGSFRPANGLPAQSVESVTLAVYRDQTGGEALWHEIQNVVVDADGHYSVVMGATQNEGMPLDLFASGEPRWLGAQFNRPGESEQPRVLLVSVPYALKAADAETLGGKPASAYLLAAPTVGTDTARESGVAAATTTTTAPVKPKAFTPGTLNYIAMFDNTGMATLNSPIYDANGNIGISTTQPMISLDVRTGTLPQMGIAGNTDYLTFFASDQFGPAIYWDPAKDMRFGKGGAGLYNPYGFVEQMRIKSSNGNVGIGTQTPGAKLDVAGDMNFSGSVQYQGSPVLQVPGATNIALGLRALLNNTTGTGNTAIGAGALLSNTTGILNAASGSNALEFNTTGCCNTATGGSALFSNTTGSGNTAIGQGALASNTTAGNNTAMGTNAMQNNTTGNGNTAIGGLALLSNTTGGGNTATGVSALFSNTTGDSNTATGRDALISNTTGCCNTAIGSEALESNTTADRNTAIGAGAMLNNIAGTENTAVGEQALLSNTTGNVNTAIGIFAMQNNTTGSQNTAIGEIALQNNTVGINNTASGAGALAANTTGNANTASGVDALSLNATGSNNIAVGVSAAANVSSGNSNNIHIGSGGSSGDSGTIRVGIVGTQSSFFVAGVRGVTTIHNDAIPVVIDSAGQLGTVSSSRRFKEDIEDMAAASRDLMRLRPVTYRYKQPFADGSKPIQYGLIAEEVAEVYPDLVAHSADGQIETVKYQVLDSMLLNEVQRQQAEIGVQKDQIRRLEERLAQLEATLHL